MNYPHLHLLVNHVPILGVFFALFLVVWASMRRSAEVRRLALWVTLLAGLSVYPAYFTGDEAHEQVEDYPGFDHDTTHEHEEAAEFALVAMLVTAGLAGATLFLSRGDRTEPRWAKGAVLFGLVASAAIVTRAAWIGGDIRHEEIRGPITSAPTLPPGTPPAAHSHNGDGDEHEPAAPAPAATTSTDTAGAAQAASGPATDSAKPAAGKTHVHKDGTTHTH